MPTLMNERARLACFGMPIVALGVYGIAHNAAKWEGNVYEVKQVLQHPLLWARAYGAGVNRGAPVP